MEQNRWLFILPTISYRYNYTYFLLLFYIYTELILPIFQNYYNY